MWRVFHRLLLPLRTVQDVKMQAQFNGYTFPLDPEISRYKVSFQNRYGINLVGDLYLNQKHSLHANKDHAASNHNTFPQHAIAIAGPFGAVKEQCAGLYAHQLAKAGFITLAFDPSFIGESGGNVRNVASPDINTEDFSAAVDFLLNLQSESLKRIKSDDKKNHAVTGGSAVSSGDVLNSDNRFSASKLRLGPIDKVGILGICGFGGFAINAAAMDTRISATVASTMYDMTRVLAKGYDDSEDSEEERFNLRVKLNETRTKDYATKSYARAGGVIDPLPNDAPQFVKDYYAYYKTERGYTDRSLNSNDGWNVTSQLSFLNMPILNYASEIRTPVLLIHGKNAHSLYFSKTALGKLTNGKYASNKELFIVDDASHTDLYDNLDKIPFKKLEDFFKRSFQS